MSVIWQKCLNIVMNQAECQIPREQQNRLTPCLYSKYSLIGRTNNKPIIKVMYEWEVTGQLRIVWAAIAGMST